MSEELAQRSPEWFIARLGKVTASRLSEVIARTKSGAWGASRANYMAELLTERLTGVPTEKYVSAAMQRGTDTEPAAIAAYAFRADADLKEVGFVNHPTIAESGASPDRLVGRFGSLEVKCPNTATHIETVLGAKIDACYVTQMQWQMACTGRKWTDFVSYDDRLPEFLRYHVRRVPRDNATIGELEVMVKDFLVALDHKEVALRRLNKEVQEFFAAQEEISR
jgi:putative phage-type endonuclease